MTSQSPAAPLNAREAGLAVRRAVMGDDFVERATLESAGTASEILQEFVTEHVWGALWTRPGLDRRSRSLLNLGMLIATKAHGELAGHVRGALNNGLSRAEIIEAVLQSAGYCGAPSALSAMRVVSQVLDEFNGDLQEAVPSDPSIGRGTP